MQEVEQLLEYYDRTEKELDYTAITALEKVRTSGRCVYCGHCKPCPMGIDIRLVNKYYDLALSGDDMAEDHYRKLEKNASDCIWCGHCESRCPFSVKQSERMQEISTYMRSRTV